MSPTSLIEYERGCPSTLTRNAPNSYFVSVLWASSHLASFRAQGDSCYLILYSSVLGQRNVCFHHYLMYSRGFHTSSINFIVALYLRDLITGLIERSLPSLILSCLRNLRKQQKHAEI